MTGKAYTMKEMKAIVNYLVEHKAFSEVRGRKMWMDFASSKDTTRTWQSLKETFLKRILPDIHNPYYKLSLLEIASFKQGLDIELKLDNKLDVEPVNDQPIPGTSKENGHNGDQEKDGDKNQENKENGEEQPGEDHVKISENLNNVRDSTETLVLEPCYDTADDIRKDLENDNEQREAATPKDDQKQSDLLEQDPTADCVNNDQINNVIKDTTDQQNIHHIVISDSEEKQESKNIANETGTKEHDQTIDNNDNNHKNTSNSILTANDADQSKNLMENKENLDKSKNTTKSSSSITIDTQLPNNPEELKVSENIETTKKVNKLSLDRKRSNRATSETAPTKRKKIKQKSVSDTDARKNCKIEEKQTEVSNCETQQEKSDGSKDLNMDVDKDITHSENLKENPENQIEVSHNAQVTSNEVVEGNNENSQCGQIQVTPEVENPCLKSVNLYEEQFSCTIYSDSDDDQGEKNKNEPQKKNEVIPPPRSKEKIQVIRSSSTDVPNKPNLRIVEKKLRENALARAFGFSSNGPRNRKRSLSYNKRRASSHKKIEISSDSTSSSYDTESDFVSPPRGNHKRHRKYLKPESHRILSLGEEGTLFVMNGRKIYPVIKNGRALKTYVTYSSDGQSDNEESYWKLKYVEERKKGTELAKQLENFTKTIAKESSDAPVAKTTDVEVPKENAKPQGIDETCSKSIPVSKATDEKSIKIKITNNEKEVQVEGPWSCINPVLEQVVQMMKDTEKVSVNKARSSSLDLIAISGISTPAETSAKRVAEMEKEIFKEIEEIDNAEREEPEIQKETDNDAETTPRKSTRKRNVSASKVASSPKKAKVNETKTDNLKVPTRRTRTPRKAKIYTNDTPDTENITNKRNSNKSEIEEQEEEVLYKFPSPRRESNRAKRAPPRPRYTLKTARIYSSPDHLSLHSEETQGYIDTDCSPVVCLRKKRKTSIVSRRHSRYRKKSIPSITEDLSSESSLPAAPMQTQTFTNSSLSSQIYRSDSYQLLMPKAKVASNYLEKIEEFSMNSHELNELPSMNSFEAEGNFNDKDQCCDLSLPTSPVLSIVENFSVNKSLSNLDENDEIEPITLNNLMPVGDVSMPLMESNYEVKKKSEDGQQFHYNLRDRSASDSIVNTVHIGDVPNSISTKLKNLVIESAKKDAAKVKLVKVLKEQIITDKPKADNKKPKAKKRSSTPRKRQTRALKSSLSDPCIEEHTETCSRAVNRSRTPIIKITDVDSEPPQNIQTKKVTKGRGKPKKEIIKVKLPKAVGRRKSDIASKSTEDVGVSNDTESGIFLQGLNDSVELIHNHSDTCCKAHECINDSLEIMEPSLKSIITIESDSGRNDEYNTVMDKNVAFEMINQNAQDGTDLIAALARIRSSSEISNSLLTDDLSNEITTPRSSKWYLLSEEENSTTLQERNNQHNSYGANLNQIFPITCAVPNLSTISEASKDIDESSRIDANRKLFKF
ncbi:uncharacterized protein LOC123715927 isoform X1 [Pieris brassicae]|uniref:uncharacterized protein LOC123715927 isoform X1 n=3 Tax=Pieris brassicae TaxID=7116 RepID=UPI001E65FD64|nr:uncharacterized protein LOC123715927 isoform X1 [Pieris brassicae]